MFDDVVIDKLSSRGVKWWVPPGVLSVSLAEMDFDVASPIRQALEAMIGNSELGYPTLMERMAVRDLFATRMKARYDWRVDPARVEVVVDVMQGMALALHLFLEEGDGVIVQTPVYGKFLEVVRETKRTPVINPLVQDAAGRYHLDLEGLRASITPRTKALLLCNPQNPTGRVFTREELEALAAVVLEHGLLLISDEIHAELVYPGARHVPIATLSPEIAARTVTLSSASKAFNLAGLRCAVAHFGSPALLERFRSLPELARGGADRLALRATATAWRQGGAWLEGLLPYLEGNRNRVFEFAARCMPAGQPPAPEATYFAWLDCRQLDLPGGPYNFFLQKAMVALSDGKLFGPAGEGFVRLNFATSSQVLEQVLERMAKALEGRS